MIDDSDIIDVTDLYRREIKVVTSKLGGLSDVLEDSHAILAGGAFTSLLSNSEINDFDIYFVHRDGLQNALKACYETWDTEYDISSFEVRFNLMTDKSLMAVREGENIQFILYRMFSGGISQIFKSFDFTINMFAYDFYTKRMYAHKDAIKHLAQRILVVNEGTEYPLVSVLRVQKYADRGFKISKSQMITLLLSITEKSYNSWESVIDEMGSMYGISADKIFDKEQPFSIREVQRQLSDKSFHFIDSPKMNPNCPDLIDVVVNFFDREDLISKEFALDVLGESRYNRMIDGVKDEYSGDQVNQGFYY